MFLFVTFDGRFCVKRDIDLCAFLYTVTDAACFRAMRRRVNDDTKDLIVIDQLMALIDDDGCDQWL